MTTNFKPATLADFPTLTDSELSTMRQYRLNRIRAELKQRDYAGILLYDPLNIRYATDTSNMQVWCTHNAVRYCFIPTEGPVTLFEFHGCDHLAEGFDTLQEVRSAIGWFYFGAGSRVQEKAKQWAAEIADLVRAHGGATADSPWTSANQKELPHYKRRAWKSSMGRKSRNWHGASSLRRKSRRCALRLRSMTRASGAWST